MQNHYNLIYREEEREMFPTLKVFVTPILLVSQCCWLRSMQMFGVGSIPWSPLGRGLLTRPTSEQSTRGGTDWFIHNYSRGAGTPDVINRFVLLNCLSIVWATGLHRTLTNACAGRVEEIAKKRGVSMAQIAIAWVLSKPYVSAPIVGTTSLDNLKDIIG